MNTFKCHEGERGCKECLSWGGGGFYLLHTTGPCSQLPNPSCQHIRAFFPKSIPGALHRGKRVDRITQRTAVANTIALIQRELEVKCVKLKGIICLVHMFQVMVKDALGLGSNFKDTCPP